MGKLQNNTVAWGNIQLDDYVNQWNDTLTIVHCWEDGVEGSDFLDLFIGDECMNLGEAYHVDSDYIADYITRENIEEWLGMLLWRDDKVKAFKLEKLNYDKCYQGEKMKTYQITLTEVRTVTVVIEAENEVEAEKSFISQHEDGEWEPYFSVKVDTKVEEQSESTDEIAKGRVR